MGCLSVFKINSKLNEFLKKNKFKLTAEIPKQEDLAAYDISPSPKLTQPVTTITYESGSRDYKKYKVHQESDTIKKPIRVYKWDYLENIEEKTSLDSRGNVIETTRGYQTITDFNILVDIKKGILYVFAKKDEANLFCKRIKKNETLDISVFELDLSKINLVPEIVDEWGAWLDDTGEQVKKAVFGTQIGKYTKGSEEYVTSYKVIYEFENSQFDLSISREGRISSNNKIANPEALLKIFNELIEIIAKKSPPKLD